MAALPNNIMYTCPPSTELSVGLLMTLGIDDHADAETLLLALGKLSLTQVGHLRGMNDSLICAVALELREFYNIKKTQNPDYKDKTSLFESVLNLYVQCCKANYLANKFAEVFSNKLFHVRKAW